MHGQRAHPLDIGADVQRADDPPQIAGHRLLKRKQLDRAVLRRSPLVRDVAVVGDDLFGKLQICL